MSVTHPFLVLCLERSGVEAAIETIHSQQELQAMRRTCGTESVI